MTQDSQSLALRMEHFGPLTLENTLEWVLVAGLTLGVALIAFGSGTTFSGTPGWSWVFLSVLLVTFALWRTFCQGDDFRYRRAAFYGIPFLVWVGIVSLVWADNRTLAWHDFGLWLQAGIIYFIACHVGRRRQQIYFIVFVLLLASMLMCAQTLRQVFIDLEWLPDRWQLSEGFVGLATGPLGNPQVAAAFFLTMAALAAAIACTKRFAPGIRVLCLYLALMFIYTLVLTWQWNALFGVIALSVLAVFVFPPRVNLRQWYVMGAAAIILAVILMSWQRSQQWKSQNQANPLLTELAAKGSPPPMPWAVLVDRAVLGGGEGAYRLSYEQHRPPATQGDPHFSGYDTFNLLIKYGLPGLVFFAAPAVILLRQAWKAWAAEPRIQLIGKSVKKGRGRRGRHSPHQKSQVPYYRFVRILLLFPLVAFLFMIISGYPLQSPAMLWLGGLLLGLLVFQCDEHRITFRYPAARLFAGLVFPLLIAGLLPWLFLSNWRAVSALGQAQALVDRIEPGEFQQRSRAPVPEIGRAELLVRQALNADPYYADAWSLKAHMTLLQYALVGRNRKDYAFMAQSVIDDAQRAIHLMPHDYWPYLYRGLASAWTDDLAMASEDFQQAITLAPNSYQARYYQAWLMSQTNEDLEAMRAAIDRAVELSPETRAIRTLRRRMLLP